MSSRAFLLASCGAIACGTIACSSEPALHVEPDVPADEVSARFDVTIDTAHASLDAAGPRTPSAAPVTITGEHPELSIDLRVKRVANRPELLWTELFVELDRELGEVGLSGVELELRSETGDIVDLVADPFGAAQHDPTLPLGGIVPGGRSRLLLGVPSSGAQRISITVRGTRTTRRARNAAPLAIAPDGSELWVPVRDADLVAIVDPASRAVTELALEGMPWGVDITPDGRFVAVAAAHANTLTIYERETRAVIGTFGEDDGIGREPRHVVASPDGSRIFVGAYVGDRITSITRSIDDTFAVEGHIEVGRRPSGIAIAADGRTLLVAHAMPRGTVLDNESWISVVDVASRLVIHEAIYDDLLNLDRAACLADVFGVSPTRMTSEGVPNQLAGPFMHPSGFSAWVPHAVIAGFPVFERGPDALEFAEQFQSAPGETVPGFFTLIDTRAPARTEMMLNPGALERPVSPAYMDCADVRLTIEASVEVAIPSRPELSSPTFAAFPTGYTSLASFGVPSFVAFTRDGRHVLALSSISDLLLVMDAATFHPIAREGLLLEGSNPTGVVVSPDGRRAYVAYESSLELTVLDLEGLDGDAGPSFVPYEYREVPELPGGNNGLSSQRLVRDVSGLEARPPITSMSSITLADDLLDPELRRGRILFSSSNVEKYPELSAITMTACASCHPEGGSDGSMWATMEGERRTMSLRGGVSGRGWLHASATHRDVLDFADIIVTERLGGHLGEADVRALARYVAEGIPRLQAPRTDATQVERGRLVFERACASCHQPDAEYGSGLPDPANEWGGGGEAGPLLFDLGTAIDDAHVSLPVFFESLFGEQEAQLLSLLRGDRDLGPGDLVQEQLDFRPRPSRARGQLKAPSLVGAHDQVVYFHDGRFERLEDAIRFMDEQLSLSLDEGELADVTAFVRTL